MRKHPFHLVDPSPWPLFASLACFLTTVGGVMYMHAYIGGALVLGFGVSMILIQCLFGGETLYAKLPMKVIILSQYNTACVMG